MHTIVRNIVLLAAATVISCSFLTGCTPAKPPTTLGEEALAQPQIGATIGSVAEVFAVQPVPVEGYGLVGGLRATGSAECQPQIRAYLTQYILKQLPRQKINVKQFISSTDTAVVVIRGILPGVASPSAYFDVEVTPLPGTQTTSLEHGWLYRAELHAAHRFYPTTKVLADAEGPVFINKINTNQVNEKLGYVLAGATCRQQYKTSLALRRPDYVMAGLIRNRINERFGDNAAKALSPSQIQLQVPPRYQYRKQKFIALIKATYLTQTKELTEKRVRKYIRQLAAGKDADSSEIALEAIGTDSIGQLTVLLNSSNQQVRFRAARCLLNLGSDRGLNPLREIATDPHSSYRIEALEAITVAARRNDAAAIARRLLRDGDFRIRLAACRQLRKLDDITISSKLVGRNFFLERIATTDQKTIFATRSGQPRIVLFGTPIYCRDNMFIQSADGRITLNAPAGQPYVSIIVRHPKRPEVVIKLKSSFAIGDIIESLGAEPVRKSEKDHPGLGVSYSELLALLQQMCRSGAVPAQFRTGDLPKINANVKK